MVWKGGEKIVICSRDISRISEPEEPQESLRPPASGPIASHYGGPAASSGQCALELLAAPSPTVGSPSVRRMIRETLPEGSSSSWVALSSSCTAISIALLMLVPEGHTFSGWLPGGVQCFGSLHPPCRAAEALTSLGLDASSIGPGLLHILS